jgi:hypothetical protein
MLPVGERVVGKRSPAGTDRAIPVPESKKTRWARDAEGGPGKSNKPKSFIIFRQKMNHDRPGAECSQGKPLASIEKPSVRISDVKIY